jgi:hypothetical protein
MLLPSLLPKELYHYRLLQTPQQLFDALGKNPADLLTFFLAACDDKTWLESYPKLMQGFLAWFTHEHLTGGQPNTYFIVAVKAIQQSYSYFQELIPLNLRFQIGEHEFPTNTLLVGMSSDYFHALIYRQCRIGKKSVLKLEEEEVTPDLFAFVIDFIHSAEVPLLWRKDELFIMQLHELAHQFGLTELQKICVETFKRYLTIENSLDILLLAHERGWTVLRAQCIDFINSQEDMAIAFLHSDIDKLFFAFTDCTATTREYFAKISHAITHFICRGAIADHPFMAEAVRLIPYLQGIDIKHTQKYPTFLDSATINLIYLNLSECDWLDDTILKQLTFIFPKIQTLLLERYNSTTHYWDFLRSWQNLLNLNLSDCYQLKDEELILILRNAPNIEELVVQNCQSLTDRGLKLIIKEKSDLQRLNLSRTTIQDETLIDLAFRCQTLQELNLSRCEKISERGIREAVKLAKALRLLNIEKCALPLTALLQLQKQYPRITFLG